MARRCIYGVDLNRIAVELARLALWIHTFVPGLPLSFLDHNLRWGNSLTGIGTLDEALAILEPKAKPDAPSLLRDQLEEQLAASGDALRRLGRLNEATSTDVESARQAHADALAAIEPTRRLFDLLVAVRIGEAAHPEGIDDERIAQHRGLLHAEGVARELQALHFPVAFPEVLLRDRPGFDCILGNPPWEEATVEKLGFWTVRFPGLKSLTASEQKLELSRLEQARPDLVEEYEAALARAKRLRDVLLAGPYPGMGTGDPDLYKAFSWRFWQLCRDGGGIGVVLQGSALSAKGSGPWRRMVIDRGCFDDVTMLLNNRGWVFDDLHRQYSVGLLSIRKGPERSGVLRLRGPFASPRAFEIGLGAKPAEIATGEFLEWSDGASFPLLPTAESLDVFTKLRAHPALGSDAQPWRARPVTEFHATNDKKHLILDPKDTDSLWPVYKGESFNLWEPDTGTYYAWADPDHVVAELQALRERQHRKSRSAFSEMPAEWCDDPDTLPVKYPRIAFRDVTNRTNQRTVIAALVPGEVTITNQAPYLLWPDGDERDEAYLLGVLCSIPLDWYARRVVERHVNFHLFNSFPVPAVDRGNQLRRRVEEIAGRLAAVDDGYEAWADAVGVPVAGVTAEDEKADLIAELDAAVALLYGLEEADVRHIFETFHAGWDYEPRLEAVLAHLRTLRDGERRE